MPFTVGQLKELLKDLPDDTPVIKQEDNFELRSSIIDASKFDVLVKPYRKEKQPFVDAFDGTNYNMDVYISDNDQGTPMLKI